MPTVADRIQEYSKVLSPYGAELVAVSKFHGIDRLIQAYNAGQRLFGESRAQELLSKVPLMPNDVHWHFIGHLQTNKIKSILPHVSMIESVDSEHLLDFIDSESQKLGLITNVLMQIHVAAEQTKTGFTPDEMLRYFYERRFEKLKSVHICGMMGMATNTDDLSRINSDFEQINNIFVQIQRECPDLRGFDTLSMGMSEDWPQAVQHGSNLVRIGTDIFGPREY